MYVCVSGCGCVGVCLFARVSYVKVHGTKVCASELCVSESCVRVSESLCE